MLNDLRQLVHFAECFEPIQGAPSEAATLPSRVSLSLLTSASDSPPSRNSPSPSTEPCNRGESMAGLLSVVSSAVIASRSGSPASRRLSSWLYRPVLISSSSKLVVLVLDHKFRPRAGRGRAALQLPIGQNGWFTGFVDPMLQLF